MRILFVVVFALVFLVACAPAQEVQPQQTTEPAAVITPADDVQQESVQQETVQEQEPEAEVVETYLGTRNFVMTVDRRGFSPSVLTVPSDYRIRITLSNEDSDEHTFDLPEFGIAENIPGKRTVQIDFISDTRGEYTWDDRFTANGGLLIVGGKT